MNRPLSQAAAAGERAPLEASRMRLRPSSDRTDGLASMVAAAAATTLEPGCMISPNIRLARKLGEGGMGSVWVADHLTLKTHVAVKFMSEALAQDEVAMARFTEEATAAAQIKSRHVVQTLDSGVTTWGVAFIVMELLDGEDLGARIARVGALTPRETAEVVEQTCKALAQAHRHGIVHRDIKPENIFFSECDGETVIKVLDFGIAKRQGQDSFSATSTGSMMGTPLYMSPEQVLSSKHVRPESDLWSVGVVAYHALTGALPFEGETVGAICVAIHGGAFRPASELCPDLPAGVDAWIARALARDPNDRFSSAKEMSDALLATLDLRRSSIPSLEPSAARTVAPDPPLPLERRPSLRLVGAALVFFACAFALVFVAAGRRAPPDPTTAKTPASAPSAATTAGEVSLSVPSDAVQSQVPARAQPQTQAAKSAMPWSPVLDAGAPSVEPVSSSTSVVPLVKPAPQLPRRKNRGF